MSLRTNSRGDSGSSATRRSGYDTWRRRRVEAIEGAGDAADEEALGLETELLDS
jgi:hypothetical protein